MNGIYADQQRRNQAESIRRQYTNREEDKLEQLKKLDGRVKAPGKIAALSLGIAGALVMGAGMALVMVWHSMTWGLLLGIPGLLAALIAYPLNAWITGKRKKIAAGEILKLSGELLGTE